MVKLGIRSFGSNPLIYGKYCLIYSLQYSFHRSISTNPPTHLCIKPRYDLSRQRRIFGSGSLRETRKRELASDRQGNSGYPKPNLD